MITNNGSTREAAVVVFKSTEFVCECEAHNKPISQLKCAEIKNNKYKSLFIRVLLYVLEHEFAVAVWRCVTVCRRCYIFKVLSVNRLTNNKLSRCNYLSSPVIRPRCVNSLANDLRILARTYKNIQAYTCHMRTHAIYTTHTNYKNSQLACGTNRQTTHDGALNLILRRFALI